MSAAIEIEELSKRYGKIEALARLSLAVPGGSVFGLLGPNGAGKSTLVKCLLSIVRPTHCRGSLLGRPIGEKKTLARVGYLPEHARFPDHLTGRQVIEYSAGLCLVKPGKRIDELLELVGMKERADHRLRTYSKGMKQRIGLAQALVNDPELVFLDEPTDGVDPGGRIEIREMIAAMREQGRTVFMNSHLLGEVEQIADEVAIMARGGIVAAGSVESLTRQENRYEIRTREPLTPPLAEALTEAGAEVNLDQVVVHAGDPAGIQPIIDQLRSAGAVIRELREKHASLEEVFLQAVRQQEQGASPERRSDDSADGTVAPGNAKPQLGR